MKHIMIAIPAYTGTVHMGTMRSLFTDLIELIKRGDKFTLVDDIGNALIADCRGVIATNFYNSDCDELVFIDSDVTWEAGALLKLIDHPVDLVAGIYPVRAEPIRYNVRYLDKPELWADPQTGLLEVECVPAGFMKISRNCIEKMIKAYPELKYNNDVNIANADLKDHFYALFDTMIDPIDRRYLSEDYTFCRRWQEIGGDVWLDPSISLNHYGHFCFQGNPQAIINFNEVSKTEPVKSETISIDLPD
jgi:hypothetical protein